MNFYNKDKLKLISGVTEFALYKSDILPDIAAYKYYEEYAEAIDAEVNKSVKGTFKSRLFNFAYINGYTINGKAFIEGNSDVVKINDGVIYKIYATFSEMILKGCFPEYTSSCSKSVNYTVRFSDEQGIEEIDLEYKAATDYNSKLLSEYLSMFATKFIILHELAHHYNGHILYLHYIFNKQNLDIKCEVDGVDPLTIQTLEMDADAFAISQLTRELQYIIINDDRLKSVVRSNEIIIGMFIFSLHCLFILMNDGKDINYQWEKNKYLPIVKRHLHNIACLETNLKYQCNDLYNSISFNDIAAYYIKLAESQYSTIFNYTSNFQDDFKAITKDSSYTKKLEKTWNDLYPELSKYARCPLNKPYDLD